MVSTWPQPNVSSKLGSDRHRRYSSWPHRVSVPTDVRDATRKVTPGVLDADLGTNGVVLVDDAVPILFSEATNRRSSTAIA